MIDSDWALPVNRSASRLDPDDVWPQILPRVLRLGKVIGRSRTGRARALPAAVSPLPVLHLEQAGGRVAEVHPDPGGDSECMSCTP